MTALAKRKQWRLRPFLLKCHLYLSLTLGLALVAVALTGAPLVWRDQVDRALNPARYAVTGSTAVLQPQAYIARALGAAGADQRPVELRYPEEPGWPLRVATRLIGADGKPAGATIVYLDPPTGDVLGVVGASGSLVGTLHNFHHMLGMPQYNGRQIVGWIGVAMLFLALSGVYLWWPRNGELLRALRWKRSPWTTTNLHHLIGFWISIPLALVSLTGIYLAFPATAHSFMSSIASVSGPMQHGYGAVPVARTALDADSVLQLALAAAPGGTPLALSLPTMPRASDGEHNHEQPAWRVRLRPASADETVVVSIDDASGAARLMPQPPVGDRAVAWITWIHEGRRGGVIWATLVFLTGIFPLVLLITGVTMWLRSRVVRTKRDLAQDGGATLTPAEQQA
jgi:uncharacterized iron-regulated membrane protein